MWAEDGEVVVREDSTLGRGGEKKGQGDLQGNLRCPHEEKATGSYNSGRYLTCYITRQDLISQKKRG